MMPLPMWTSDRLSRRRLIAGFAQGAGAIWLGLANTSALAQQRAPSAVPCSALIPQKSSKADARHQLRSSGGKRCDNCRLFLPPDQCVVVEGPTTPDSSCALWAGIGGGRRGCDPDQPISL